MTKLDLPSYSRPVESLEKQWIAERLEEPYGSFVRLVRGFDPRHRGLHQGAVTVTLDSGCGFGGNLVAACLDRQGDIVDSIEA